MRDIYNRKKTLDNLLVKLNRNRAISKTNKQLILKFYERCVADGLGVARICKYMYALPLLAKMLKKDFDKATKDDIIKIVVKIESDKKWSEWSKQNYKVIVKRFYKWLKDSETYPKEVSWVRTTMKNNNHKLPETILTEKEIFEMVKVANNARDKALILILYESGCRIGEILNLQIKDIQFDEYGATIIVSGKTGQRRVRLIKGYGGVEALKIWLDIHPFKDNTESYVWLSISTNSRFEPIGHRGVTKSLSDIAEKAKITKRVNPHAFRHARATHLANVLTEAQMKEMFGWTQGSEMASIYVHLSGRDVDKALIERFGNIDRSKELKGVDEALKKIKVKEPELYNALLDFVNKELNGG